MSLTKGHRAPVSPERHVPVLLHECLEALDIQPSDVVVDATLGGGGHAEELAAKLNETGIFVGIDADSAAILRARDALADTHARVHLIEGNFRSLESYLGKHVIPDVTKVLFDLGWSAYQLSSGRGFSFLTDEPLRMTYSTNADALDAATIVNTWSEESIADVIYGWGEEGLSRKIARAIVAARESKPIETSRELADIIARAIGRGRARIHPATKTFQALRIAVNDELGALENGLDGAWRALRKGGRIAVISFHSIEDRVVKNRFRDWAKRGEGSLLTKSPIRPGREELLANPRARSAKLRVIEKG